MRSYRVIQTPLVIRVNNAWPRHLYHRSIKITAAIAGYSILLRYGVKETDLSCSISIKDSDEYLGEHHPKRHSVMPFPDSFSMSTNMSTIHSMTCCCQPLINARRYPREIIGTEYFIFNGCILYNGSCINGVILPCSCEDGIQFCAYLAVNR